MDMQWLTELKQETCALEEQLRQFCQDYPLQNPPISKYADRALAGMELYTLWVSQIPVPHETEIWPLIDWHLASHDVKNLLVNIKVCFEILVLVHEKQNTSSQSLMDRAQVVYSQFRRVFGLHDGDHLPQTPCQWSTESDPVRLSPYTVLAAIHPLIPPHSLDPHWKPAQDYAEVRGWPRILYHPYHTTMLLIILIPFVIRMAPLQDRHRQGVRLIPCQTHDGFEIHTVQTGLTMTPILWDELTARVRMADTLEYLRELGGDIQPLTWDTGQGQGLIVRLPWAKD